MKHEKVNEDLKETALIVFVRFPSPGKVKSRLAESLGDERAAAFYRRCAEKIFSECGMASGVKTYIFYSDRHDREAVERWAGPGFRFSPQHSGGLGERIKHALGEVFSAGAKQAIIMASDVPDLSANIINDAVSSLARYNIVIGPSLDGGYYLLGMKKLHEELFKNIDWSTGRVLRQTVDTAGRLGLTVERLPALRDIDTGQDLEEWLKTAEDGNPVLEYLRSDEFKGI